MLAILIQLHDYVHTYTGTVSGTTDTGGLSTDLMIALGVGIVTLAAIILVSCCAKKHCNNQMQCEGIICTHQVLHDKGLPVSWTHLFTSSDNPKLYDTV